MNRKILTFVSFFLMQAQIVSARVETNGMEIVADYLKSDKRFDTYLSASKQPNPKKKVLANRAFSALAGTLDFVGRAGLEITLENDTSLKGDNTYLEFESDIENDGNHRFVVHVSDDSTFGEAYFSTVRECVIARKLAELMEVGLLDEKTSYDDFLDFYANAYADAVCDTAESINIFYKQWIEIGDVKIDKKWWNAECVDCNDREKLKTKEIIATRAKRLHGQIQGSK